MWEWLIINGAWVFIASVIGIILLIFIRRRVQAYLEKAAQKEAHKTLEKSTRLTAWVIEGILLVTIAISAVAAIISERA